VRHDEHGYYNGAADDEVAAGTRLGIDIWAGRGIVGRAVLIDLPRHLDSIGRPQLDHLGAETFPVGLLGDALVAQGTRREHGDVVLIRTGWLGVNLEASDPFAGGLRCAGLLQSHETLAWLWDTQVSLIAADNAAVESFPPGPASELHA